ncbi:MAG: beta-galactosidase trimerization domain-containing protein, partial [Victivallales bacterium]
MSADEENLKMHDFHFNARFLKGLILLTLCLAVSGPAADGVTVATSGKTLGKAVKTDYAPAALRGYGTVSGTRWEYAGTGQPASILLITCENPVKARITHAKYLSDLALLPGVKAVSVRSGGEELPAYAIDRQGVIASLRTGPDVVMLAASTERELAVLYAECLTGDRKQFVFTPEAEVPMYLDRWDRFGFRFYYRPWERPKDKTNETYDITGEFKYAEKMDRAGFLFWNQVSTVDNAEGMMNYRWWDWGLSEARDRKLPVGIQFGYSPKTWLANRYREQTAQKMPMYCGDRYDPATDKDGGQGAISWNAGEAMLAQLAQVQQSIRDLNKEDVITSWLEPFGELQHGAQDILMEYGPVADRTFRTYLQEKYGTLEAVSRRWTGDPKALKNWEDVRVPELASFLGWDKNALDLSGTWRVKYLDVPKEQEETPPAPPAELFTAACDDTSWPTVQAPGHDRTMFLPKKPAVYRRTITVPAAWRQANPKAWIYVWDMNKLWGQPIIVNLNGQEIGRSKCQHPVPHWAAYETAQALKAGDNQLTVYLPQGYLAYRIYLSAQPPQQYPSLGATMNARWVDFSQWIAWSRVRAVDRSMQMIRQVDPDRGIMMMAPDVYANDVKNLCVKYGGEFHNTGYMGAFWADYLPMLMRGADLPFSLEPGGPAMDLENFKKQMGLYATEGIQGIDYFIHIGNIMWNDEIRRHFEEHQNEIRLIGKYHLPKAETAILYSSRIAALTGYPWGQDPNAGLISGYWRWNLGEYIKHDFQRDGLTESDFASGNASKYRIILDSNTSVMEESLVGQIENYVRNGGIFVTYVQTGRNTPEQQDAWPINRLTGYRVAGMDKHRPDGQMASTRELKFAEGQPIFKPENWGKIATANGLSLEKVAPECKDLIRWTDGTTAVGMRPLGKGLVIHVGVKFAHDRIWSGNSQLTKHMFTDILDYCKISRLPARLRGVDNTPYSAQVHNEVRPMTSHSDKLTMRHYVSNNGLYNIWTLWNSQKADVKTDLVFAPAVKPEFCLDVRNWQPVPVTSEGKEASLQGLNFSPLETKVFITPRQAVAQAPSNWFDLQRNWWRGATKPTIAPLPEPKPRFALDLSGDWAFKPVDSPAEAAALTAAGVDSSAWERMRLGIWNLPKHPGVRHAVLRKQFTVPATWKDGRVDFWLQSYFNTTFMDEGRVFIDGKMIKDFSANGVTGDDLGGTLQPGTSHEVVVEMRGKGTLNGSRGNAWLAYQPAPQATQDLAGD